MDKAATDKFLATYLGTTPENYSRIQKELMKKDGISNRAPGKAA